MVSLFFGVKAVRHNTRSRNLTTLVALQKEIREAQAETFALVNKLKTKPSEDSEAAYDCSTLRWFGALETACFACNSGLLNGTARNFLSDFSSRSLQAFRNRWFERAYEAADESSRRIFSNTGIRRASSEAHITSGG
ncbi:hypothetical protein AJ87_08855 [Rhizobium yanglingense]|nr:hypothetical protein AJ87_08855 [Rhizobium yanglingense]